MFHRPSAHVPQLGTPIGFHYMLEWEGGELLGQEDVVLLQRAATQGLSLVTYDRRTIPPILKGWAEEGHSHGGVIFVDEKTLSPTDIGGLVRALAELVKQTGALDWTDRIYGTYGNIARCTVWGRVSLAIG